MIAVMQAANVSGSEAEAAIRKYLFAQCVHGQRLEKQMRLVNELVRPRLRG